MSRPLNKHIFGVFHDLILTGILETGGTSLVVLDFEKVNSVYVLFVVAYHEIMYLSSLFLSQIGCTTILSLR